MQRLLIIGNDREAEEAYRRELGAEGFSVEVASDAREGVDKVKTRRPDLVILDLCMPQTDGIDCLESVRECDREVPVLLHANIPESWGDFRLWSADSYVEKSDDLGRLKKAVRELLTAKKEKKDPVRVDSAE